MIRATTLIHSHDPTEVTVTLDYDARFKRRIAMRTDQGEDFLLDLPKVTDMRAGDHLVLEDGRHIAVIAAEEPLMKISAVDGQHLTRLTWHIGNRHLPCQIEADHLLIRPDHVIKEMIEQLGGRVEELSAPFTPEGGAYGHGRTHSHEH
ncbi:MAG: urease accessory protein UreE [Pseudomonadota bacterium]